MFGMHQWSHASQVNASRTFLDEKESWHDMSVGRLQVLCCGMALAMLQHATLSSVIGQVQNGQWLAKAAGMSSLKYQTEAALMCQHEPNHL